MEENERDKILDRVKLARELIDDRPALKRLILWKSPQER